MPELSPSAAERLHFAALAPVRLGMPELCRAGLSESWLLKACGHRHWLALASAYGLAKPDFRTARGARLYPAFTSVRLEDGKLDGAGEDDVLDFAVTLMRTGRTRFRSDIAVTHGAVTAARLVMETAFVQRVVAGCNHGVSRAEVARPCALLPPAVAVVRRPPAPAAQTELASFVIDPSPHEDFNGADFLYFAAFQAIVDRAEWRWLPRAQPLLTTARRDIAYFGNIEPGEQVRVVLSALERAGGGIDHRTELYRSSDDRRIASVTTHRRPAILQL